MQPLNITLSHGSKMVSLDQHTAEAEGYYHLLQGQVQDLSKAMNSSTEADKLRSTAKNMLDALRQCIHLIKDSELTANIVVSSPTSSSETPLSPEEDAHSTAAEAKTLGSEVVAVVGSPVSEPRSEATANDPRSV